MLQFERSTLINAPVEVLWKFHERSDILEILTPPWQPVQVIRREGGLEVGAIAEFRIFIGPFPVQWIARHTECQKDRIFTDEQIVGPMQSWVHQHQFTTENGKTSLTDKIQFEMPGGWLVEILLGWWVKARLSDMFRYRHEVTIRECESK